MSEAEPYVLDPGFECDVVGYLVSDREFFGSLVACLLPDAFPTKEARTIVGLCFQHYNEHGQGPGNVKVFAQLLRTHCLDTGKVTIELMNKCLTYLADAIDSPAPIDDVRREFAAIVKQRYKDDTVREFLLKRDFAEHEQRLELSKTIGKTNRSRGLGLTLADEVAEEEAPVRVPTGVIPFDYLLKGGLSPRSLFAYLGDTGDGKSLGLAQMAAAAIREGLDVLYHACEMTDRQCRYRIVADLTETPFQELEDNVPGARDRAEEKLRYMAERYGWGRLSVKYTEPDEGTPLDTEQFIKDFTLHFGNPPHLAVIDYADRLTFPGLGDAGDYKVQGKVWQKLQIIACRYEIVVATASQAKQLQKGQKWLGRDNFADSKRKVRFLDVGASLNWNSAKTMGGLHLFKGRKGLPVGRTLMVKPNWPYSRISEISERVKGGMRPSVDRLRGDYGAVMTFMDALTEEEPSQGGLDLGF